MPADAPAKPVRGVTRVDHPREFLDGFDVLRKIHVKRRSSHMTRFGGI